MTRWADALVSLLQEQGMTQAELARRAGVHPDTVGHLVRGGHCSTDTLEKLAAALEVDLGELFGAPPDKKTATLQRDRLVSAVLRELSGAVSAAVLQELALRHKRRTPRRRASDVELPFSEQDGI
jgi:transcriptional regulator with XRE-family HTH domain